MVVVSYSGKEINAKLVYYGPGLSGKTTNLEFIYDSVPSTNRGKMVSMKTRTERTLFFDFLPVDLGEMGGFKTRFLLYTVPGQVYYNATRKLVLRGVDAVVFVADSGRGKMNENIESLENLKENLREYGMDLDQIPWVIQYNKRDLPDVYTLEELNKALNPTGVPAFEAVATNGTGVFETFKGISRIVLEKLSREIKTPVRPAVPAAAVSRPAPASGKVERPATGEPARPEPSGLAFKAPAAAARTPESGPAAPAGMTSPGQVNRAGAQAPAGVSHVPAPAEGKASLSQKIVRFFRKPATMETGPAPSGPESRVQRRRSVDAHPAMAAAKSPRPAASLARVDLEAPGQGAVIVEKMVRVPVPVRLTAEEARQGVLLKLVVEIEVAAESEEAGRTGTR